MSRTHGFRSPSGKLFSILAFWLILAAIPLAFFVTKSRVAYQHAAGTTAYPSAMKNVFVIVMENEDWSNIKGNITSAPYINSLLSRSDASYASNYHNVTPSETSTGYLHPSEPNYMWMEAGTNSFSDYTFTNDNDASSSNSTSSTAHLATLLTTAGISWKAYEENISGTSCPLTSSYPYAAKHDPFVFFQDVTANNSSSSSSCIAHVRPYTELATDLASNTVPSYSFITPNLCDDMHDSCSPLNNNILQGDTWLKNNLPPILNSSAYTTGGAVFITWDEDSGSTSNNPVGMIVLSPHAKGNGYTNTTLYSHSSYVKTVETIFGLSPLLANAATATDLSDLFVTSTTATPTNTPTPTIAVSTPTPTLAPTPVPTNTPTPTSSDPLPPTVTILSPLNGSTVHRHSNVTITATASDDGSVTQVSYSMNGSLLCTTTTSPYSCSWFVPGKPHASYTITATAYDAAGNTGTNSVTVTAN